MLAKAWVFRCDAANCRTMQMVYVEKRKDAVDTATQNGWQNSNRWYWLCPKCAKVEAT